jgi:hypothetical protein
VPFELSDVVPWGRSFDEYMAMFALSERDLARKTVGCADGPASFNARLTARGGAVVSVDPLYRWSADEIRERIATITPIVLEQTRQNADAFVWTHITSIDGLADVRRAAMTEFLADYDRRDARERYIDASLPSLPFADRMFELAICSHFLFLYSAQHDLEFHVDSLIELARVAEEVRVFPLLELGGSESRHLRDTMQALGGRGLCATRQRVPYEFQRGGNEMLIVRGEAP